MKELKVSVGKSIDEIQSQEAYLNLYLKQGMLGNPRQTLASAVNHQKLGGAGGITIKISRDCTGDFSITKVGEF